jgi:hypothetical protein
LLPSGSSSTKVKAIVGGSKESTEITYQPQYKRLFGLSKLYESKGAKYGDQLRIEKIGENLYKLDLLSSEGELRSSILPRPEAEKLHERDFYKRSLEGLRSYLKGKEVVLEVTAFGGRLPAKMERALDSPVFFFLRTERHSPDIMGYVVEDESSLGFGILAEEERNLVVAEVKDEPATVENFYQAKRYGEVFDAKYAFLISTNPLPEEIRRFISERPAVTRYHYSKGERDVIFAQLGNRPGELIFERFTD